MAKIEVNKYLGSSQDNFLVFSNSDYERPYVTFYFTSGGGSGEIVIHDALDEDGYTKTIKYSPSEVISDSSFKTAGDRTMATFSLLECLKKNVIFYDIELKSDIPNVGIVIVAKIDSSTRYEITVGNTITLGGTYSSWTPKEPNKFVLMENNGEKQIFLEKFTMADDVSFNVTAPYEHLSFKDPFQVKMLAYHIDNNSIVQDSIANNTVIVYPTTLTKFDDIDLGEYMDNGFLTHNFNRPYNYGEVCALSVMTSGNPSLTKKYYTNSGVFLMQDSDVLLTESKNTRKDFYFKCNVQYVESQTNKQVGYVEVSCGSGKPVIYTVEAKCNDNHEIFFVNEIGGIDSFNFLGENEYDSKINKQTTYFINPTRKYTTTKELEVIGQHINKVEHTLKTTIVDSDTAVWLNEMQKSKYQFLYFVEGGTRFERIIITEMNISVSDRNKTFEVELTYQRGDANIAL